MSSFSRFRGTHRLASSEAGRIVLQILRETPETRGYEREQLSAWVREMADAGVGEAPSNGASGDGYRQVMTLLTGVLLRIAGASVEAVNGAVAGRSGRDLERLVEAILKRMTQIAEQGEPVRRLETSIAVERNTIADADDDRFDVMVPDDHDDFSEQQSPALSYLVDLAEDTALRNQVHNVERSWSAAASRLPFNSESTSFSRETTSVRRSRSVASGPVEVVAKSVPGTAAAAAKAPAMSVGAPAAPAQAVSVSVRTPSADESASRSGAHALSASRSATESDDWPREEVSGAAIIRRSAHRSSAPVRAVPKEPPSRSVIVSESIDRESGAVNAVPSTNGEIEVPCARGLVIRGLPENFERFRAAKERAVLIRAVALALERYYGAE